MLHFKSYLNEEVMPTAQIKDGSIDIEIPEVREQINATLTSLCSRIVVTPYILYNKVAKALAYFHIILPKRPFLEGDRGVDVIALQQFGTKMGMTDKGEFVKEVPPTHYLYISYQMVGTGYSVRAKVVGKEELDNLLDNAERSLAEGQLDELSRNTLGNYLRKATDQNYHTLNRATATNFLAGRAHGLAQKSSGQLRKKHSREYQRHMDDYDQADRKSSKRADSIQRAIGKVFNSKPAIRKNIFNPSHVKVLAKEETLNELHGKGSIDKIRSFHQGKANELGRKDNDKEKREGALGFAYKTPKGRDNAIQYHMSKVKKARNLKSKLLHKEETLNELNRKTLSSYIRKASDSRADNQLKVSTTSDAVKNPDLKSWERKKLGNELGSAFRKVINRRKGINRAADRLSK